MRNGEPIWKVPLSKTIATGITVEPLIDGEVPEYDCREAARFCGYTPREFWELAREERAATVAQYRLSRLVELHAQDVVTAKLERRGRRG